MQQVLVGRDLRIEKAAPAVCETGTGCDFTITVTNIGPEPYSGPIVVHDELPAPGAFSAAGPWTCASAGLPHISCTHPAMTLDAGDSVALTIHWIPSAQVAGRVTNCVDISWDGMSVAGDLNPDNDHACAATEIPVLISAADLALVTTGPHACVRGSACPVSVTLANIGRETVTARLSITGMTSPAVPVSAITALGDPGWSCSVSASGYECHHNPLTLRPKGTQRFQASLQIPAAFAGNAVTHRVELSWIDGQGDSNRANDSASVTISIVDPQCPEGQTWNGQICVCPSGLIWSGRACVPRCSGGRRWNGQTCACQKGFEWNGEVCVEETPTCTGGRHWDGRSCVCPERFAWNGRTCVPYCGGGRFWNGHDCVCQKGFEWNARAQRCVGATPTCTGGRTWNGQACVCSRGLEWNARAQRCIKATPTCTGGRTWNGQACVCSRGLEWNARAQRCIKATPNCTGGRFWNGRACVCKSGLTWNGRSCVTSVPHCTGGRFWNGRACVCKSGLTWNGQSCVKQTIRQLPTTRSPAIRQLPLIRRPPTNIQ